MHCYYLILTDIVYDQYGRILSKTTPEISTAYSYNTDGLLQTETSNNGTGKNITYDALGRTVTFKETGADSKWLQKTYTYLQGQLHTVSYTTQSGAITTETNGYQNGYLKTITLTGGQVIYDLQEENSLGSTTKVLSGPVTRNYTYDQFGMPTGSSAQTQTSGTYMNFDYSFNAATGNLNSRKDVARNITENFTYDSLNRLTGFGGQTVSFDTKGNADCTSVKPNSNWANGCITGIKPNRSFPDLSFLWFNITQKSGIGNYHYLNNSKPYALTGIVQSGNVIPERQQQITYASFSRPLTITEDGYSAQFIYEAGGDRVKMQVIKNGVAELTRHYLANQYELDEKPGSTREKLYLGGDYYSAGAVLVRDNGGAWQVFYINSDYLGSVTHVVNSVGSVVAEYSYDAWGRLRNPVTHAIYAEGQQPELFLGRGYTGHEHLAWFGLINMNARLYDPVHGRFLAPDPYVQAPDFTQSFNRYGYVWGNPLKYTDETGEWFGIDDLIIAGVSFAVGYVSHGISSGNWGWNAVKSGLISAGTAWLTYKTAGAASSFLMKAGVPKGLSILVGNGIGGGVGSFAGNASSQLLFTNSFNIDEAGRAGLYGLGFGLGSGLVDISPLYKKHFPMNHTVKYFSRTIAGELIGGALINDFESMTWGLNAGAALPFLSDVATLSARGIAKKQLAKMKKEAIDAARKAGVEIKEDVTTKISVDYGYFSREDGYYLYEQGDVYRYEEVAINARVKILSGGLSLKFSGRFRPSLPDLSNFSNFLIDYPALKLPFSYRTAIHFSNAYSLTGRRTWR